MTFFNFKIIIVLFLENQSVKYNTIFFRKGNVKLDNKLKIKYHDLKLFKQFTNVCSSISIY